MRISRHHSESTRNLNAALKALTAAQDALTQARDLLREAGGGSIADSVDGGTFNALFELTRGRDGDGNPEPGGQSVIESVAAMLNASAEQDDANRCA